MLQTGTTHIKSTCITGILEAKAAYMLESVKRFIDTTNDLVFQEAFNALEALITQDSGAY